MTSYRIEYNQTPEERYDTDMNDRARALIDAFGEGVAVSGESGGTDFSGDVPASEQCFYVMCSEATAIDIASALSEKFGREVRAVPSGA